MNAKNELLRPVHAPASAPREQNLRPPWTKGQSGNPSGVGGLYREAQRLAREGSPRAVRRLIELVESDDERVASVAANSLLDRAWGRARDYDPKLNDTASRTILDFSKLTREQLKLLVEITRSGAFKLAPVEAEQ
jgi:hypothetical protein